MHPLDNPVWEALHGPHRDVAESNGLAARYVPDVSSFGAFPEPPRPDHWDAMGELLGPGQVVILTGHTGSPPDGWGIEYDGTGVQMTGEELRALPVEVASLRPDLEVLPLSGPDSADMVELVALARPGPFTARTWQLGGYVGVRVDGRLVAMAGQRFRPTGWCEISAVATHPDHRRQGLAEHLVRVTAAGIVARGEVPLLHVAADNTDAIRLYEAMGFSHRSQARFMAVRSPEGSHGDDSGGRSAGPRLSQERTEDATTAAAGMPDRCTVWSTFPVVSPTSTNAELPLHTQACPEGLTAMHWAAAPSGTAFPTTPSSREMGVMPKPALTHAVAAPGTASIPVGFAPRGMAAWGASEGRETGVTLLVWKSATSALVVDGTDMATGPEPTGTGGPAVSDGRARGVDGAVLEVGDQGLMSLRRDGDGHRLSSDRNRPTGGEAGHVDLGDGVVTEVGHQRSAPVRGDGHGVRLEADLDPVDDLAGPGVDLDEFVLGPDRYEQVLGAPHQGHRGRQGSDGDRPAEPAGRALDDGHGVARVGSGGPDGCVDDGGRVGGRHRLGRAAGQQHRHQDGHRSGEPPRPGGRRRHPGPLVDVVGCSGTGES